MYNPLNGCRFGQERTAGEFRARAEWDRQQGDNLVATAPCVGWQALADGHYTTARAYDAHANAMEVSL